MLKIYLHRNSSMKNEIRNLHYFELWGIKKLWLTLIICLQYILIMSSFYLLYYSSNKIIRVKETYSSKNQKCIFLYETINTAQRRAFWYQIMNLGIFDDLFWELVYFDKDEDFHKDIGKTKTPNKVCERFCCCWVYSNYWPFWSYF